MNRHNLSKLSSAFLIANGFSVLSHWRSSKIIAFLCGMFGIFVVADFVILTSTSFAAEYKCKIHNAYIADCTIWKNGKELGIGGFQGAPVFKLNGAGKAVDHRGYSYSVVYRNGNTSFLPVGDNPYSGITILGGDFR